MTDQLTPESVTAILHTGHGTDAGRLFEQLRARGDTGPVLTLPAPTIEWLDGLDEVSDDTVVAFIQLLWNYPWFDPPLTPEQVRDETLEANLRYGSHRSAFQHALQMSMSLVSLRDTSELLTRLGSRGVEGLQETEAAKWLISYLLDDLATRPPTIRALWWMRDRDDLRAVVDYVRPQLAPDELAELDT